MKILLYCGFIMIIFSLLNEALSLCCSASSLCYITSRRTLSSSSQRAAGEIESVTFCWQEARTFNPSCCSSAESSMSSPTWRISPVTLNPTWKLALTIKTSLSGTWWPVPLTCISTVRIWKWMSWHRTFIVRVRCSWFDPQNVKNTWAPVGK